jgi:hypothetical protein
MLEVTAPTVGRETTWWNDSIRRRFDNTNNIGQQETAFGPLPGDNNLDSFTRNCMPDEQDATVHSRNEMSPMRDRLDVDDEVIANSGHEREPVPFSD